MAPKKGSIPTWGNPTTMNLNELIYHNILSSRYFKEDLYELNTYHEVVDEIYSCVTDLEPFMPGQYTTVSSAFCLLYKLFTMKVTEKQMVGLLNHKDSAYIRGLGCLYLRYCCPPTQLWDWLGEYIDDPEPIKIAWAKSAPEITIGQYVQQLLTQQKYFSTMLPRIPVPVEREIKAKLLELDADVMASSTAVDAMDYDGGRRSRMSEVNTNPRGHYSRQTIDMDNDLSRHSYDSLLESRWRDSYSSRSGDRDRDRDRERSRGRERERSRDRDRDRDRERERERERSRGRERERSRDRERERSRGRERERSRGRERERERSRGRERERSREKDRDRERGEYCRDIERGRERKRERYDEKHKERTRDRDNGNSRSREEHEYRARSESKPRDKYGAKERERDTSRPLSEGSTRRRCRDSDKDEERDKKSQSREIERHARSESYRDRDRGRDKRDNQGRNLALEDMDKLAAGSEINNASTRLAEVTLSRQAQRKAKVAEPSVNNRRTCETCSTGSGSDGDKNSDIGSCPPLQDIQNSMPKRFDQGSAHGSSAYAISVTANGAETDTEEGEVVVSPGKQD